MFEIKITYDPVTGQLGYGHSFPDVMMQVFALEMAKSQVIDQILHPPKVKTATSEEAKALKR